MLNVTVTKNKSKVEIEFPKLMKRDDGVIIEVHKHPEDDNKFIGIWRSGENSGVMGLDFYISGLTDFDGEITIKNK